MRIEPRLFERIRGTPAARTGAFADHSVAGNAACLGQGQGVGRLLRGHLSRPSVAPLAGNLATAMLVSPDGGLGGELRRGRKRPTQFAIVTLEIEAAVKRRDHERELSNAVA